MKQNKTNKKNLKKSLLALALVGTIFTGGITAFLTDVEFASNEFTNGKLNIELTEEHWDPSNGENITPNKEVQKDPQITNIDKVPGYVFAEVIVPYENGVVANEDGTRKDAAEFEIASYTVNEGWIELKSTKDEENKTITHVYAYCTDLDHMTVLNSNEKAPKVFDKIKWANYVENQGLEGKKYKVDVYAKAIQSDDLGATDASTVYTKLQNQKPTKVE